MGSLRRAQYWWLSVELFDVANSFYRGGSQQKTLPPMLEFLLLPARGN